MMIEGHAPGCDGRHTPRQACNALAAGVAFDEPLTNAERAADEPPAPAEGAFDEPLPEDEGKPAEAMLMAEDELVVRRTKAVADGPLRVIDTTKVALLPVAAAGAIAVLAFVLVARLVRGGRRPTR